MKNSIFRAMVTAVLCFQMVSCGTLLYPERRGQKSGRLDVGVVLLDGVGLLLFLIPGIVAFAVDFSTGTIYLPPEKGRAGLKDRHTHAVAFDRATATQESIEKIIRRETGAEFRFSDNRLKTVKLKDQEEAENYLALLATADEIALLHHDY